MNPERPTTFKAMADALEHRSASVRFWAQALLLIVPLLVFSRSLGCEFINFDDPTILLQEKSVYGGISWENLHWAFTHTIIGHWAPLTTISHQLVAQCAGLNPVAHHFANVLLHSVAALLLGRLLWSLTGAFWRGMLAAAFWALHPLRVESVSWVTERKDVLSGVFFMLTLLAYVQYRRTGGWKRYLLVTVCFAAGLLSKSMLVTVPFVLLLLDFWPLQNPAGEKWGKRIVEKLPWLGMSVAVALMQLHAAEQAIEHLPLSLRLGNAAVSYSQYLAKIVWPIDLCIYYPHPGRLEPWRLGAAILLLAVMAWLAWNQRRARLFVLVGFLWFFGMLVPVIGIVQVASLAMADRYSYLPSVGIFMALVWTAADCVPALRVNPVKTACGVAGVVLLALVSATVTLQGYWENSENVFRRALAVTKANDVAHLNLANCLSIVPGREAEAAMHYRQALEIRPDLAEAHLRLGWMLFVEKGKVEEALKEIAEARRLQPGLAESHYMEGMILVRLPGRLDAAITAFQEEIRRYPNSARNYFALGNALSKERQRWPEAEAAYVRALQLEPNYAEARTNYGSLLMQQQERAKDALEQLTQAVRLRPDLLEARLNLALTYARFEGGLHIAIKHLEAAERIAPSSGNVKQMLEDFRRLQTGAAAKGSANAP